MPNNTLYLIGGTGSLGLLIAKGLATASGFESLKALVRDMKKAQPLAEMGWECVQVDDFKDVAGLKAAMKDAKVVVSTVGGGDMVELETAAMQAAKQVGATLYVPSQFGVDYRRWGTSFPFLAGKKKVLDTADELGLPTLKVFTGLFSDFVFDFLADPQHAKGKIVGDGTAKLSFTRRSDIGYVLAKALADPKYENGGCLSMEGDNKSWKEGLDLLGKTLGKEIDIEFVDAEEALKQEEDLLQAGLAGDMGAFYGSFALHLLGEPARGNTGGNVGADANMYDVKLETLEETLTDLYGQK